MSNILPPQTIESLDLNLDKIFSDFYIVPNFQREYVWSEVEVEQLLEDIYDEFTEEVQSEYFIGSLVVCPGRQGILELIDGQQRMTTSYIFLCALRDYLRKAQTTVPERLMMQIKATNMNDDGEEVPHYRVTLMYEDSGGILGQIAEGTLKLDDFEPSTRSIQNIVNAYRTVWTFLEAKFADDVAAIRRFYAYFINRVKLVRIKTHSIAHALKVFETINDRGVGLDSMDLLKNLMFITARQSDFDNLKTLWKDLVDTLYNVKEKPLRFLRYFIFATYNVERLREDEIYKWFTDNKSLCGYDRDPIRFVSQLSTSAKAYASFVRGKNVDGTPNRYLSNIAFLSGAARQHLILLLAGQHLGKPEFAELSRQIENLLFAYLITREATKDLERIFAAWASEVRQIRTRTELDSFIDKHLRPNKEGFSRRFEQAFRALTSNSLQAYRLRYVLGKLAQYINEYAYGVAEADLKKFIGGKVQIEHVLPQKPDSAARTAFDKPDEIASYIPRLGNLTLLEQPINGSIKNGPYEHKKPRYGESNFLLTRTMVRSVVIGKESSIDQAVRPLQQFDIWNSMAIDTRQEMLTKLAKLVWEML